MARELVIAVGDKQTNFRNIEELEKSILCMAGSASPEDKIIIDVREMRVISYFFFKFITKIKTQLKQKGISLLLRNYQREKVWKGFDRSERESLESFFEPYEETEEDKKKKERPWNYI